MAALETSVSFNDSACSFGQIKSQNGVKQTAIQIAMPE
jgi:hypothetical protein